MNRLMAVAALVVLIGFVAILLIHVPRLDLAVVIGVTVALAGWDVYTGFDRRS